MVLSEGEEMVGYHYLCYMQLVILVYIIDYFPHLQSVVYEGNCYWREQYVGVPLHLSCSKVSMELMKVTDCLINWLKESNNALLILLTFIDHLLMNYI